MTAAKTLEDGDNQFYTDTPVTVLIVDDHQVTADLERKFLSGLGFQTFVASSEKDLERYLRKEHVDLLIMDLSFAKNQGLVLIKSVKRQALNKSMKVIATSVVGTQAHKQAANEAGADMFLVKPAPRTKILKEIKTLVSQKARTTERVKKSLSVTVFVEHANKVTGETLDISGDGVHIKPKGSSHKPTIGSNVEVTLVLDSESKTKRPLIVSGVVMRHTNEGFGVKFGEMSTTNQRLLDKFLLELSMEGRASKYYL